MVREDFFKMVHDQFQVEPDCPFEGDFVSTVFRRPDNLKWFAIVLTVDAQNLGIGAFGDLDIVNLKISPEDREKFRYYENVLPAYHMSKKHWISIVLDEQEDFDEQLIDLTRKSFLLTAPAAKRRKDSSKAV